MYDKLFIYGSLSQGMVHFGHIQNFIKNIEVAHVLGSMYRLPVGYPVFLNEGEHVVKGHVVDFTPNETLWLLLDELHGVHKTQPEKGLHERQQREAVMANGERVNVQIYVANQSKLPRESRLIANAHWEQDLEVQPPLTDALTESQVNYLKKLGRSSGRDILPIKLELYRELMKLELIVDKGRRLALSKLGKEVFRYL